MHKPRRDVSITTAFKFQKRFNMYLIVPVFPHLNDTLKIVEKFNCFYVKERRTE